MSSIDVTVTDRDRAAARKLPIGCECNCKYNVRCHHDEIALALAQARSEGAANPFEETQYIEVLERRDERVKELEEALRVAREETDMLRQIIANGHNSSDCPNGACDDGHCGACMDSYWQTKGPELVEECRCLRIEVEELVKQKIDNPNQEFMEQVSKLSEILEAIPTTASTETDAKECKEDLVEFLKAAWDTETGFTNGNSFYRQLGPLYEKYCGTKIAQDEPPVIRDRDEEEEQLMRESDLDLAEMEKSGIMDAND